jgi:hypothetical protein
VDLYFFNLLEKNLKLFSLLFAIFIASYIYITMFNTIKYVNNLNFKYWLLIINILGNLLFGYFIFITFKYHFEKFYKNPATEFNLIGQLFKEIPLQYKIQISDRFSLFNLKNFFDELNIQKSKPYDINFIKPDSLLFESARLNILLLNDNAENTNYIEFKVFFLILICIFLPHLYKDYSLYNECLKNYNYNYLKRFLDPNLNFYNETDLINLVIDKSNQHKKNIYPYEISYLYEPNKDALFFTEYLDIIYPKNISITNLVDFVLLLFTLYIYLFLINQWESLKNEKYISYKIFLNIFKLILFVIIFFCLNTLLLNPFSYFKQSLVVFSYILACLLYFILGFL